MGWMPRSGGAVIAFAAACALVACSATPSGPPAPRETAGVVDEMACFDPFVDPPAATAGLLPPGFAPVALLECVLSATREDEAGTSRGAEIVRYEGDFTEFFAAISAPSEPAPGPDTACPAMMVIPPQIWATDAAGRSVLLSFPMTTCSFPKEDAVLAELAKLEVVDRTFVPVP